MNPFSLTFVIKIIGWCLVLAPLTVVFVVSLYMILGAMKDDEASGGMIGGLVTLGGTMFFLGAAMLLLAYFTNILSRFV